jgi:L-alanine-DL-glutamate epimerase-like enolase superfamily enzyme
MQITTVEVTPTTLHLRLPYRTAYHTEGPVTDITAVFVRLETQYGRVAWGCAAFDPLITGETPDGVTEACRACGDRALNLSPLNLEYALAALAPLTEEAPSALCAFDIAFHDLLGLEADMPLYRMLGGYRDRIQTSITISLGPVDETVELAQDRVRQGFRILKIKGGLDPDLDVRRVRAVCDALPGITVRLDADGGYPAQDAIAVARALEDRIEMLEQPVDPDAPLHTLRQVTEQSPVPILADQSVVGAQSAMTIATNRASDGLSIKLATCGGLRNARQIDAIARAAHLSTMVGCVHEPALLISAELAFALSSPAVRYGDLDGSFDLTDDPTVAGFVLEDGWLIAKDVPGLGCIVDL